MSILKPGANAKLSQLKFTLSISHAPIPGVEMDVSAFLLTAQGKVRGDGDMCFYGQTHIESGAVILDSASETGAVFSIDLSKVNQAIEKIVIVMTIHENRAVFGKLSEVTIELFGNGALRGEIPCAGMKETALILAEIYRRGEEWKLRVVGQGFENGLPAIAQYFGIEVATPEQPVSESEKKPIPAKAKQAETTPVKSVRLNKISLTKQGESSKISLQKENRGLIRVIATWVDNGDKRSDNDDLDLRAGILLPNGKMHWLAASHPGSLDSAPFARHLGDVRQATKNAPGTEIIEINPDISKRLGGQVGLVFSVYSAISNGPVSIASLKPVMSIENDGNVVECNYTFPGGKAANGVYTYVIGTLDIDGESISVRLSGLTSQPGSEDTPWIERKAGILEVSFDGAPVFKSGRNLFARMIGVGKKGYENV
ncbi:TerD family protein [Candidatus Thiothrix sp. Deng01]|uniref:TerD family protein n=1 Tax=Candidatus Thiothrix phosphatis TaxID=3112415 RepID=A0ABU6CZX9_9GAMM|nr:TerD family protein [Candidatus Thiothrix sp. Deng01]MEB4591634.1 TerD family protein [Candidatus Thiothrix sp. Deng01]